MNYKDLKDAHEEYLEKTNWNRGYANSIKRRDVWSNLKDLEEKGVSGVVLHFLNEWRCHIPYKRAPGICKALKEADRFFNLLENEKLETIDFEKMVDVDEKVLKTQEIVSSVFRTISPTVAPTFGKGGYTATSKIMHMVNPELFPMWDRNIRRKYGSYGNTEGYLLFVLKMQSIVKGVIKDYCEEHGISVKEAKKEICRKICSGGRMLTLVKLVDEYNYTRFTLKKSQTQGVSK